MSENKEGQDLPLKEYLSASTMNAMLSGCSMQVWFKNQSWAPEQAGSDIMSISKVTHDIIDESNRNGNPDILIDENQITERIVEAWRKCIDNGGKIWLGGAKKDRSVSIDKAVDMSIPFLAYIWRNKMYEGITELEIEPHIYKVNGVPLLGYVDRISLKSDGVFDQIYDWKAKTKEPKVKDWTYRQQMLFYVTALEEKFFADGRTMVRAHNVYYFPGGKGVKFQSYDFTMEDVDAMKKTIKVAWDRIVNAEFYPNNNYKYCQKSSCDFWYKCPINRL